jgi:tetratricopeptide (TPR) repeat protein
VIDISHESLIRNWQRLKEWVNEEATSVRIYRRVAETAVLHREGSEGLMQDPALAFALDWREKSRPNEAWAQRYHPEFQLGMEYLDQSRLAHQQRVAEEEKRRNEEIERDKRELEQTKLFVAQQARAARRMRVLLFALCVILMLAVATAAYAWNLRTVAVQNRIAAEQDRRNALESAAAAEKAKLDAQHSQTEAEISQHLLAAAKKKAEDSAELAKKQTTVALENLQVAQAATSKATAATAAARENAQQVADALERGELMRMGLESARREDFARARDSLEQLEQRLKLLQPGQPAAQKFKPDQLRKFSRDYGWTQSRLGDTYHKLREFDKAIEHYEQGRAILEGILKDEPAAILFETYHGLAHSYHDNAKIQAVAVNSTNSVTLTPEQQLLKAEEYYKKAATYQEATLKSDNPVTAVTSLKNLSQLYLDIGRYDEAEQRLKSVVEVYKTVEYRPGDGTIAALKELAEFFRSRGRYEEAKSTYNELIDIQEGLVNSAQSDPEVVRALSDNYNELSQIYNALKDERRSEAAFREAEKIQQVALKVRNQRDLIANLKKLSTTITLDEDLDVMGDSYIVLERYPEAAQAYEASLRIREEIRSEQNAIAVSYLKLGNLYREQFKNYEKAEDYYKRLIQNRKNLKGGLMGPGDPLSQYVRGLRTLASLYIEDMNKPAEAEALLNEALNAIAPINGRLAWDDEVNTYGDLRSLYQKQQKDVQPVQVRKLEAMSRRRNDFTNAYRSPDYQQFMYAFVTAAGDVADLYLKQQNNAAAEAAYAQVFNTMRLQTSFLTAKQLGTYLTNLEKYQVLLRGSNKVAKAAEFDAFLKEARERQKDLESIQTEAAEEKASPKP